MELTMTLSPWMIRTTAKNRFDNQLTGAPVANHRRQRSLRLQTRFTRFAPHAANRSPTPGLMILHIYWFVVALHDRT